MSAGKRKIIHSEDSEILFSRRCPLGEIRPTSCVQTGVYLTIQELFTADTGLPCKSPDTHIMFYLVSCHIVSPCIPTK